MHRNVEISVSLF